MDIAIVGLGLIGGSLAKSIKAVTDHTVYGYDISVPVICKAKLLDAIDDELTDERLQECDIVILGLYPRDILDYLEKNAAKIKKGAIVVDCGGVKRYVCEIAWRIAEEHGFTFIGGHPMEGLAKMGFEHARSGLFKNASMILVPGKNIDIETMKKLKDVFDAIGFTRYEIASPEKHDRLIAYTSQLAHVLSSAYIKDPAAMEHRGFSAGSFRDMTRVAYLNEKMWAELFMLNADELTNQIDALIGRLAQYSAAIKAGDEPELTRLLREGRECKSIVDRES